MKIVYCIAGTYNSGGMERVLSLKANYLAGHGYDVTIVTSDQRGRKMFFDFDKRIKTHDLGINYDINNGKPFADKLLHFPVKQYRHRRRLTRLLKEIRADIVVSMFNNDASFIHKIDDGSRKILEVHFSRYKRLQYGRKGLWRLADRWMAHRDANTAKHYDRFVVLTREDMGYWRGVKNIQVIPNARSFETPYKSYLDGKRVIAVGRLERQKGFDMLIGIWQSVCERVPDWHLDIIGEGPLHEDLQRQIDRCGISDSVSILEPTPNIIEYYMESSILAMTSRYEGFPMVLLETMTCGVPAVSFACKCGPADIITDGRDGFLTDEGDRNTFADRLVTLMGDADLRKRMGAEAKKTSERYSIGNIMGRWVSLFNSTVRK
jgi:glycosyltransferase involved in cell wall biosynthesis